MQAKLLTTVGKFALAGVQIQTPASRHTLGSHKHRQLGSADRKLLFNSALKQEVFIDSKARRSHCDHFIGPSCIAQGREFPALGPCLLGELQ